MYFSAQQIAIALSELVSLHPFFGFTFLALKRFGLPVGEERTFALSPVLDRHLQEFFQPNASHVGFYNPFSSSRPADKWVNNRYASTTLQRITKDTFGDCFIHKSGSTKWGWRPDYVERLKSHLGHDKIPARSLVTWLYRQRDFGTTPEIDAIELQFKEEFFISELEFAELFRAEAGMEWGPFSSEPITSENLLALLGGSPNSRAARGQGLEKLVIEGVGPIRNCSYEPAARLNVLTGDNSVGKTFLLDAVWWASTGTWANSVLSPQSIGAGQPASMRAKHRGIKRSAVAEFSWDRYIWSSEEIEDFDGVAIYARHDGSFAIYDRAPPSAPQGLRLTTLLPHEVRQGKTDRELNISLCNGMHRDWVSWQTNPSRHAIRWARFSKAIECLSPDDALLKPGEPTRTIFDQNEVPTLRFPYGVVPLTHVAAGVGRVLALAYVLVWAWARHEENRQALNKKPAENILLLVDEIEAHLHPRWQRRVVPSLFAAMKVLAPFAAVQVHIATHSPLVLASLEPLFDRERDALFSLKFEGGDVGLMQEQFERQGRIDRWLTHPVFGLGMARSVDAEIAIEKAKELIVSSGKDSNEASDVHAMLLQVLAQDDDFWPGWIHYLDSLKMQ